MDEEEKYLDRLCNWSNLDDNITRICLTATKGLISFRRGDLEKGKKLYLKSISETKSLSNSYFKWLAILNYAREEILSNNFDINTVIDEINKIPDNTANPDINKLKRKVIKLYNKK